MNTGRLLRLLPVAAVVPTFRQPLRGIDFTVGFEGVPETITGAPGELKVFDAFVTLTTTNAGGANGAQGWLLVVRVNGGAIRKVSVAGLEVETIFDDDGDPATPPLGPRPFQLANGDFVKNVPYSVATEDGSTVSGAIISMVLKFQERVELEPRGTQRIARLTVEARVPADGGCAPLEFQILEQDKPWPTADGPGPLRQSVFGVTFYTGIVYQQVEHKPVKEAASVPLCAQPFRRGDANDDARVDISDAIAALGFLFLDAREPGCLDAADSNDDDRVDISDVIFILDDLFGPYSGTRIPAPGPFACGLDPTAEELGCSTARTCPVP